MTTPDHSASPVFAPDPDYCETCADNGLIPGWLYAELAPGCWSQAPCPDCTSRPDPAPESPNLGTPALTLTQQRRASASTPKPKKRVKAWIWRGRDESLGHHSLWNVEIDAPGWGNDIHFETPGFDTCDEAVAYIGSWASGRGVACVVSLGKLVTK